MSDLGSANENMEKYFDVAADIRKFEIGLFWQRSLFFWGFIGASFVGYAALENRADHWPRLLVTCFGFICSIAWTLLNRGSKYWQEAWESKVERAELKVLGMPLFSISEAVQNKGMILSGRRYSVSKLVIALSDFTCAIWLTLISLLLPWKDIRYGCIPTEFIVLPCVILYAIYIVIFCRSSRQIVDNLKRK